jgi:hypothetical protein
VNVYLRETSQSFIDPSLLSEGLFSAGVFLAFADPFSGQVSRVLGPSDIRPNPAFNDPFSPVTRIDPNLGAGMLANVSLTSTQGVRPVAIDFLTSEVFLGTFRFTGLAGGTASIQATHFSTGDDTLTFRTGTVLDSRISSATATLTVAPVPEPAGLVLVGAGLLGIAAVRFRGRRPRPGS